MNKNKYVDFIPDKKFLECVKWVCDSYPKNNNALDIKAMQRNTIDPFKLVFDLTNTKINVDTWIKNEKRRQQDKTINNRIGEFHQKLLGNVKGWTNLGTGDETKVDLKREDNSIFIELKNKQNTVNSDSLAQVRSKLEKILKKYPKAIAYWAYILDKTGYSGEKLLMYKGKSNSRIKVIWGKKVYQLVTGDPKAIEKVWKALPIAILDITKSDFIIDTANQQKILEFFAAAFRD